MTPFATTRSASMSSPESVSSRIASFGSSSGHLQDLVALLLAAREAFVHAAVEERGIHLEQLHLLADEVVELERIELVLAARALHRVVGEAQEGAVA